MVEIYPDPAEQTRHLFIGKELRDQYPNELTYTYDKRVAKAGDAVLFRKGKMWDEIRPVLPNPTDRYRALMTWNGTKDAGGRFSDSGTSFIDVSRTKDAAHLIEVEIDWHLYTPGGSLSRSGWLRDHDLVIPADTALQKITVCHLP